MVIDVSASDNTVNVALQAGNTSVSSTAALEQFGQEKWIRLVNCNYILITGTKLSWPGD